MAICINCRQELEWDSDLAWKHLIMKDCFGGRQNSEAVDRL